MSGLTENKDPDELEAQHVHAVYDQIADHFSATRYKPWPVVDAFLKDIPDGSLVADVGCGNGKYLGVNPNVAMFGSDRSVRLIEICRDRGFDALVADNLILPYRSESFDYVISIAVVHHFSNPDRRRRAIQELFRILKPGGQMLVFVWALEQEGKRQYDQQDVFVPWKLAKSATKSASASAGNAPNDSKQDGSAAESSSVSALDASMQDKPDAGGVYQRYYHLFVRGELEQLVAESGGGCVVRSGYDRDNHFVVAERGSATDSQLDAGPTAAASQQP